MHLITTRTVAEAATRFPQYKRELLGLGKVIEKGNFPTPAALKKVYPSLDNFKYLDKHYVIDIARNDIRVVALIFFESQKFYLKGVYNHAEYDRFTDLYRGKKK